MRVSTRGSSSLVGVPVMAVVTTISLTMCTTPSDCFEIRSQSCYTSLLNSPNSIQYRPLRASSTSDNIIDDGHDDENRPKKGPSMAWTNDPSLPPSPPSPTTTKGSDHRKDQSKHVDRRGFTRSIMLSGGGLLTPGITFGAGGSRRSIRGYTKGSTYQHPASKVPSSWAAITLPTIAVIGANGRTGSLCVVSCLRRGIPVRALTRTGTWTAPDLTGMGKDSDSSSLSSSLVDSPLLSIQQCDARSLDNIRSAIRGCGGVIYAASASKRGGIAKEVDNDAVVGTGNVCIEQGVARYVVISSTATTRPKSLGYLFTNVYQNIMAEKRLGEIGVAQSYADPAVRNSNKPCSYSIIRAGGLEEPKLNAVLGPSQVELSQGDVLAGIISRADLAEVAVEATLSTSSTLANTSFEVYYTESAQPCERRFTKYLNNENGENVVARIHGDSYTALFDQLNRDGTYFVPS